MHLLGPVERLATGNRVAVVEEWRERFWSKRLQRIVSWESDVLVTFERAGSLGRFPRYRGANDEMSRDERKMLALQSGDVLFVTMPSVNVDCLWFYRADRWASVSRGHLSGDFIGWYVDFGLPPQFDLDIPRITTMDLVLDAAWEAPIRAEAYRLRQEVALGVGPFSSHWDGWRRPQEWGPLHVRRGEGA